MPKPKNNQPPHMGAFVVRVYRETEHLSQKELADAIGIGLMAYRDFESEREVDGRTLTAILKWFMSPPAEQVYA